MGTNSDILEMQTASFRAQLPSHFSFEFLEGQGSCTAADGVDQIYPGPYLCWYEFPPSIENVAEAHRSVDEVIAEDGPFDAVLGFSQGAGTRRNQQAGGAFKLIMTSALAASILLRHELEAPLQPPPFRLAVFICGSLPFSINESSGFDLSEVFQTLSDPLSGDIHDWQRLSKDCRRLQPQNVLPLDIDAQFQRMKVTEPEGKTDVDSDSSASSSVGSFDEPETPSPLDTPLTPPEDVNPQLEKPDHFPGFKSVSSGHELCVRRFHPSIDTARIHIPTIHIFGKDDPYLSQSHQLVKMCTPDLTIQLVSHHFQSQYVQGHGSNFLRIMVKVAILTSMQDHGGGHDIPRSERVSRSIARAIEKGVAQSERML